MVKGKITLTEVTLEMNRVLTEQMIIVLHLVVRWNLEWLI